MVKRKPVSPHQFAWFDTPLGKCAVSWTAEGITCLQLPERTKKETLARLSDRFKGNIEETDSIPAPIRQAMEKVGKHLDGKSNDLSSVPIDYSFVPPFHCQVYQAARRVPPGQTASYRQLAEAAGSPSASRAVGQAMARNPFPLIVPCHRILGADGSAIGFSAYGGCGLKEKLLSLEGAELTDQFGKKFDMQKTPAAPGSSRRERKYLNGETDLKSKKIIIRNGGLQFDPQEAVSHVKRTDKRMAKLIEQVGDLRLELDEMLTPFEALAESIVYQQLTGKAAATIFSRVKGLYGGRLPAPKLIVQTPEDQLRSAGLSNAKALALKDLALKAQQGMVPSLAQLERMSDDEIVETLTAIRGIGRWTVEMLLIFRLGRPDVLPVNDYGVRKGFALTYGRREELPTPKELFAHGERWRPFRSVASWYLWRATDKPVAAAKAAIPRDL